MPQALTLNIKKGLDLPISGRAEQAVSGVKHPAEVAVLGSDYPGMKPHYEVTAGEHVKLGQVLFTDRKKPSVKCTSPGSGKVVSINRGARRALTSLVIALEGDDEITFNSYSEREFPALDRKYVAGLLLQSGLWTSIRSRPFSRVADPDVIPHSIFVTAMDTNPLAPSVEKIIQGNERHFTNGIVLLSRLTEGKVFLCKSPGDTIPWPEIDSLSIVEVIGPHPAGNVGTHIHFLDPVNRRKQVWYINAQDVIAIGILFATGRLNVDRVISLAGPGVKNPGLIKTRLGASTEDVTSGELREGAFRVVSGSVLSGHTAGEETGYLGRYHQQISVLPEGGRRTFLGWLRPGTDLYSTKNIVLSRFIRQRLFDFTTSTNGSKRAIVPVGAYEKVMPLDILPTYLLRALAADDIEEAENLGCLELDEEDLALCTFVCPSKIDHGAELRRNLSIIEKEG